MRTDLVGSGATADLLRIAPSNGRARAPIDDATTRSAWFQSEILDGVCHPIIAVDLDRVIVYWNRAAEEMFGWTEAEAVGRRSPDLISRAETAEQSAAVADAVRRGMSWSGDYEVERRDGSRASVHVTNRPVFDAGRLVAVIGSIIDTTRSNAQEDEVRMQARLLQAVGQAVVAVDPGRRVIFWNDAATALYGWTASEALGASISTLLVPAAGWGATGNQVMEKMGRGRSWSGEFWINRKDGVAIPILATDTPVYSDAGDLVAWIGVSSDLTQRIKDEETQARLSAIVSSSDDAIIGKTLDGTITSWNAAAESLFGFRPVDVIGRNITEIVPPERIPDVERALQRVRGGHPVGTLEAMRQQPGSASVVVSLSMSPVRSANGEVIGASTIARDVTEQARLMEQVEDDRRRMSDAQRSARLGSFEFDLATGGRSWSDEMFRILGLPITAAPPIETVLGCAHPDDRETFDIFRAEFEAGVPGAFCTIRVVRPGGTVRWAEIKASPLRKGSQVMGGTVLDVTDRVVAQEALEHRAHHDPLTDLPNRARLSQLLERALADQQQSGAPVAVAFLDLDHFKVINDSLGHNVGDEILIAVAGRLRHYVDEGDVVGRFGGDEFIVVRPGCVDTTAARCFAEQLRRSLEQPIVVGDREFTLVASVGVALSRPDDTPSTVLRDADTAMYHAKELGRNRAELFDERLRRRTEAKLTTALELRIAVEHDQLRVVYQPIVSLATQQVVGFEALLRWDHPERGELAPGSFVPTAEDTGLIVPIGHWVLSEALTQLAVWQAADPAANGLFVSVNLSAKELASPGLVASVAAALAASELPAHLVHLEITESAVMEDVEHSVRTVHALRALGLRLSIDDFGTGYSSLSYLKQLPVNTLKIDRSFVSGLDHDLQDRSIAQAIIALGNALGLEVLAEGVETRAQAETLVELGCHLGQGYLWSRPVPPDDAIVLACPRLAEAVDLPDGRGEAISG
ncbi:MAG: diguanylate cyclase/phosphodiesterase with sensor(S) [Acidimicrobiales bacterium]|nr:diguanylate cyclase/phosphodiesterase with sensor(S) [Acidimicrobiales bacterium]